MVNVLETDAEGTPAKSMPRPTQFDLPAQL